VLIFTSKPAVIATYASSHIHKHRVPYQTFSPLPLAYFY
jgi:hypothetical protein